ncbi:MAG: helix-turn-helix domain-containing protein [Pseudomonadota bacterium]
MTDTESSTEPKIGYVDVSPDMRAILNTLFVTRSGEGRTETMMPAYSAQVFSFVEGSGALHFPERDVGQSGDVCLNAPMLRAAPMIFSGPVLSVGASFTPLGWAAFSGLAADKVHDTVVEAQAVTPAESLAPLLGDLARVRAGDITPEAYCRSLEAMVRTVCEGTGRKVREDHANLVAAIDAWLESEFSPPVERLYDSVELGQRQVQRLCRRYYGVPPAQLVKRYRAIRAAILLAHEDLSDELRDEVVGAYFDQAHLIHDIRRYTGRTPKALSSESLAQDMLDPKGHGKSAQRLRAR